MVHFFIAVQYEGAYQELLKQSRSEAVEIAGGRGAADLVDLLFEFNVLFASVSSLAEGLAEFEPVWQMCAALRVRHLGVKIADEMEMRSIVAQLKRRRV